ncbi:MAG: GNAT family N-acetyltransferase [Candidatus Eremiobacteraeota bacterium]|nr:GNAT family N-acetyltransferase [Candidatus Eremiobacteraeota bacterium]MBV8222915.1 GNAT family N-acetyltransferase [Candidatus Eremiobacteraeota bacterium]MBV8282712.1 GNAT family N-acetyltransferase [Candidatus Eremiobacteraeota bacterium]
MSDFTVSPLIEADRGWLCDFIAEHWDEGFIVTRGAKHFPASLEGFAARRGDAVVGVITYRFNPPGVEIVTLNSVLPDRGVGTALIDAVRPIARAKGVPVWLITTNDNLRALRFYQKRGFTLKALHRNALEVSRTLKPIETIGLDGIPLRDEIDLELADP